MSLANQESFEESPREERGEARFTVESDSPEKRACPWDRKRTKRLFRIYRKTRDPSVRDQIVECYLSLARFYAWKYSGRGVDYEDLYQEGCVGLVKAVDGFDPSRGVEFHTYAIWFVEGWIRQYFRDKAWICKVPRSVKGMSLQIKNLSRDLGRFPTKQEIAELCDIPEERIEDAVMAAQTWGSVSFYQSRMTSEINPFVAREAAYIDEKLEAVEVRLSIEDAARKALDSSEAEIVRMYYYDDLTQREIASKFETYQMMVSRSLKKSAGKLGAALSGEERMAC